MKKIFMVIAMAVAAITANAQQIRITPHLGLGWMHFSQPSGSDDVKNQGFAFLGGAEFEYYLTEKFGVSAGLDYVFSRSDKDKDSMYGDDWMYYQHSYLNIPVLAQYHFGSLAVKAGVQPAFLISADYHDAKGDTHSEKDGYKSFSLSLPVGLSYDFKFPLTLDLRYAIPLTKQNKEGDFDVKQTTVALTFGYRF